MAVPSFPLPPQGDPETTNSIPRTAQDLRNVLESGQQDGRPRMLSSHPDREAVWVARQSEAKLNMREQISPFSSDLEERNLRTKGGLQRPNSKYPLGSDAVKILLASSLVVVPIISFTITILWIVFTNRVGNTKCPYPAICPGPELVNATSPSDYFVDFPAARLAFVSSLSSTISFTLVSAMMTMYAYWAARQLLKSSDTTLSVQQLPNPHQLSVLLRMLNADVLAFWDVVARKVIRVFWHKEATSDPNEVNRTPSILRDVILVFLLALLSSAMIQVADTYLHIASEAVNLVQTQAISASTNTYGRGLAPWCLDRSSGGPNNKDFWGCGITVDANSSSVGPTNRTLVFALSRGMDSAHEVFNFTDTDGTNYAIIGPSGVAPGVDWMASSYAVSSKCEATPAKACNMTGPQGIDQGDITWAFNCTSSIAGGVDLAGNFTNNIFDQFVFDNQKYLAANGAFSTTSNPGFRPGVNESIVGEVTDADTNDTFRNPWTWAAMVGLGPPEAGNGAEVIGYATEPRVQTDPVRGYQFILMHCNTTVYDVTYTAQNQQITSLLSKTKSNGTVAGISSMPAIFGVGMDTIFSDAAQKPLFSRISFDSFISSFALGQSRGYAFPLASQTSPREALAVQQRASKLVTKFPVAALWLLVVANMGFVLLGVGLAVTAWLAARMDKDGTVGMVQNSLGIAGLVKQMFEGKAAESGNERDVGSFGHEEKGGIGGGDARRIGVESLSEGGRRLVLRSG
ncbi:hypothetical protein K491DRAFT_773231 [Lophiostoma macrostomum CBS 122681]|uniref:Uncharacterized protein n=1 Tax=Lophiostoma macrostomum CBS 122681 TaxID=1314788 RepID=A0A6A6TTR6_9PLEO|nr:hypothetical protein K491DRAFT_773231 [Lophiostoma macrostomum CBS 122681]